MSLAELDLEFIRDFDCAVEAEFRASLEADMADRGWNAPACDAAIGRLAARETVKASLAELYQTQQPAAPEHLS